MPKNAVETYEVPTVISSHTGHTGSGTGTGTLLTNGSGKSSSIDQRSFEHSIQSVSLKLDFEIFSYWGLFLQKSSDLSDPVENLVKVDLHKLYVSDSSAGSSLLNIEGTPKRRKSILKPSRSNSISPPARVISAEQIMEKAVETTLNFIYPQRRYTARKRILANAHKQGNYRYQDG